MRRLSAAVLVAAALLGAPVLAADQGTGDGKGALGRANERATDATRGTAKEVGRVLRRANEDATDATRGTARTAGEAVKDAADDLGKAFRDLGKKLSE